MKGKKTGKKKWIVVTAVVAAVIIVFLMVAKNFAGSALSLAATEVVRTATAERNTVSTEVTGSGTLETADTMYVQIPSMMELESVLVEAGDSVVAGDVIATINPTVLQNTILDVQDAMAVIDEEIEDVKDDTESSEIESSVSGRVKEIYAAEGNSIGNVTVENGALMVVSLDGKMKVEVETSVSLEVGDDVEVTLSDGEVEDGEIEHVGNGSVTITLTDNGPLVGDTVQVTGEEDQVIGSGVLEINKPLDIMGGTGTVKEVNVEIDESISEGETLITLTEEAVSREYEDLIKQREDYEEALIILNSYTTTNTITALADGIVSEVMVTGTEDNTSSSTSSDSQEQTSTTGVSSAGQMVMQAPSTVNSILKEAVGVDPSESEQAQEQEPSNPTEPTQTTEIAGPVQVFVNNPVTGNTPQNSIMPGTGYTGSITWVPQVAKFEQMTVYSANIVLNASEGYMFAQTATASVTGAQISNVVVSADGKTMTFAATFPTTSASESSSGQTGMTGSTGSTGSTGMSGMTGSTGTTSGSASTQSYSSGGSSATVSTQSSSSSSTTTESSTTDESTLLKDAFAFKTGGATSLTVSVDELDILKVEEGQAVEVVLDAMPGTVFSGSVTGISGEGNEQTGVTTYPVDILIANPDNLSLMDGMNASITIISETAENVITIPMVSLQESQGQQFVYVVNGMEEEGEIGEMRAVTTGLSDGVNVEIVSGLEEGEQVAYTEIQASEMESLMAAFGGGAMSGGVMSGGGMSGGGMPSGGGASGGGASGGGRG